MFTIPVILEKLSSYLTLLTDGLVEFCCLCGLTNNFIRSSGLGPVLVWGPSDILSSTLDVSVVSNPRVVDHDHGQSIGCKVSESAVRWICYVRVDNGRLIIYDLVVRKDVQGIVVCARAIDCWLLLHCCDSRSLLGC